MKNVDLQLYNRNFFPVSKMVVANFNNQIINVLFYHVYDNKDRLTKVVPPGSTNTSATLNYEYTYDGADNILSKKIPDQAWVNYKYNG